MKLFRFDRVALTIALLLGVALFFAWREAESWKLKLIAYRANDLIYVDMAPDGSWAANGWKKDVAQGKFPAAPQLPVVTPSKAAQSRVARLLKSGADKWREPVWSPDAAMVFVVSDDVPRIGERRAVFSAETGSMMSRIPASNQYNRTSRAEFSPDNRVLAFVEGEGRFVRFFDPHTGRQLWSREIEFFAFTRNGRHVVALERVGGVLNQLVVYEAWTGKMVRKLKRSPSNQSFVNSIVFSPDGTQILISDHGGQLWQIRAF